MDGVECDLYNVNFGSHFGGIFLTSKTQLGIFHLRIYVSTKATSKRRTRASVIV